MLSNSFLTFLLFIARLSHVEADLSAEQIASEWVNISANNTRKVYNFGIGSLFSYASRQYSEDKTMPNNPFPVAPLIPSVVDGIQRSFNYCWRYVAAFASECSDGCGSTFGGFFELTIDTYPQIRNRESNYDLVPVTPKHPYPAGLAENAYYFAWGGEIGDSPCEWESSPNHVPIISQAYWDFMIGGILSWDGQITDSGRYIWDIEAELEDPENIKNAVHKFPALSYSERYNYAVTFVETTKISTKYVWRNDRTCPLTGNAMITPKDSLTYPEETISSINASAIGTVSPMYSQVFHDLVDKIMVAGGRNLKNRFPMNCSVTAFVERSIWTRNPYYDELVEWRFQNNDCLLDQNCACTWDKKCPNGTTCDSTNKCTTPSNPTAAPSNPTAAPTPDTDSAYSNPAYCILLVILPVIYYG